MVVCVGCGFDGFFVYFGIKCDGRGVLRICWGTGFEQSIGGHHFS